MQKRHIAIVLLTGLLCAALLASCRQGNGTETNYLSDPKFDTAEALPQYDHDNTWTHRLGESNSCATEDTLYFSYIGENIYYCDLSTGIIGPLCGKPECSHDDSQCNAYAMNAHGLSVYDGRLYWLDINAEHDPTVYCMALDGTDRTAVCSFALSQFQKVAGGTVAFHRGYAVFSGRKRAVTGGAARYNACIFAVALSTGEVTGILERDAAEGNAPEVTAIPYRDTVYLIYSETAEGQTQLDISTWSLKTHETVLLHSQKIDFFLREVWPTEDGLLLSAYGNKQIYKFDPLENTFGPLFDFCAEEGENRTPQFANDYLISWSLTEERIPRLRVTDLEGSVVYDENLNLPDWPTQGLGYALMGADNENVYARLQSRREEPSMKAWQITTIVQIPLDGGGSVRELWSVERELG